MCGVYLADIQLITKYNKVIRFFLCFINHFSNYAWVVFLKDKKGISIVNSFQSNLKRDTNQDSLKRKPS